MRTATIYNYLVEAAFIGSGLILLTLLVRPLFRRAVGSRLLCLAWLLVVMRLLLPLALPNPAMNALKPTLSQDPGIRPMADQVRTRVEDTARSLYWKSMADSQEPAPLAGILLRVMYAAGNGRLSRQLMAVYFAGAGLTAAWMLWQNLRFRRRMVQSKSGTLTPGEMDDYHALCRARGWKPLEVWRVEGVSSSCRMGRRIYLPAAMDETLLPMMLLRETCHHRLTLYCILRNVCCAVHWFNPLVWLAAHLSRTDAEAACDRRATAPMDDSQRKRYARLMLTARDVRRATPSLPVAASCITMGEGAQRLRIRCVLHPTPVRKWAAVAYIIAWVLMGLTMFATDVQTSLANLPTVQQQSIRTGEITDQDAARAYALDFLTLEGVAAQPVAEPAYIAQTGAGWLVEWYAQGSAAPMLLSFTPQGEILSYVNPAYDTGKLHPLAAPILHGSLEGQPWCSFLAEFTRLHMPECYEAYHAMEIVRSGRLDGEQFIILHLLDARRQPLWEVTLQVAPVGRMLSFVPVE